MKMIAVAWRQQEIGQPLARRSLHAATSCFAERRSEDPLAVERRAGEFADDLAAAHHQDAVAHGQQLLESRRR